MGLGRARDGMVNGSERTAHVYQEYDPRSKSTRRIIPHERHIKHRISEEAAFNTHYLCAAASGLMM